MSCGSLLSTTVCGSAQKCGENELLSVASPCPPSAQEGEYIKKEKYATPEIIYVEGCAPLYRGDRTVHIELCAAQLCSVPCAPSFVVAASEPSKALRCSCRIASHKGSSETIRVVGLQAISRFLWPLRILTRAPVTSDCSLEQRRLP